MKPKPIVHKLKVKITRQDWFDNPIIADSLINVVSNHIKLLGQLYGNPVKGGNMYITFEKENDK
jgi:hypothetical protein